MSALCDGCGRSGATETLWLSAPLGLCAVRVHKTRECAKAAKAARGGGRFVTLEPYLPERRLRPDNYGSSSEGSGS